MEEQNFSSPTGLRPYPYYEENTRDFSGDNRAFLDVFPKYFFAMTCGFLFTILAGFLFVIV